MIGPHYELHVLYIHFTTYLSVRRPGISPQQQSSHLRIRWSLPTRQRRSLTASTPILHTTHCPTSTPPTQGESEPRPWRSLLCRSRADDRRRRHRWCPTVNRRLVPRRRFCWFLLALRRLWNRLLTWRHRGLKMIKEIVLRINKENRITYLNDFCWISSKERVGIYYIQHTLKHLVKVWKWRKAINIRT